MGAGPRAATRVGVARWVQVANPLSSTLNHGVPPDSVKFARRSQGARVAAGNCSELLSGTLAPLLLIDWYMLTSSRIEIAHPSVGRSPAGFPRYHFEMAPAAVARLVGYDPRTLVQKPSSSAKTARGTRDLVPHNIPLQIVSLQNRVQRSIDGTRVSAMVNYLSAAEQGAFADWGPIELLTTTHPTTTELETRNVLFLDSEADYFVFDGQHRYCALLDYLRDRPEGGITWTQAVTVSVLPQARLEQWAGQAFHDRNYFATPVRAGKALAVDSRDPLNALTKSLDLLPAIVKAGGIAYERDTLLAGDSRLTTHAVLHRFVRGFLGGRPGLDGRDVRAEPPGELERVNLGQYLGALSLALPWSEPNRDVYVARASAVFAALAVVGHDLFSSGLSYDEIGRRIARLSQLDWRRTNLAWVGVLGTEKDGKVQPASSRPVIDGMIRFLRERLGVGMV